MGQHPPNRKSWIRHCNCQNVDIAVVHCTLHIAVRPNIKANIKAMYSEVRWF